MRLIDQRLLPGELRIVEAATVDELCTHIATLAIRGAPSLGAAGAFGVASASVRGEDLEDAVEQLVATRPTAVNLAWGARRVAAADDPVDAARRLVDEEVARHREMGRHGAPLVPEGGRVLTHCNAGGLACIDYGSALGVIRAAHEQGRRPWVWVDETRPLLQGARLTVLEVEMLGIPYAVIPDVAAGSLLAGGEVDLVVVGSDRIAANGDVANKIGTYPLAVLADCHDVPFYVAAPTSTVDPDCPDGASIPVEERDPLEVLEFAGVRTTPAGAKAHNPAFDVTPAALVTGYVTEQGVSETPPLDRTVCGDGHAAVAGTADSRVARHERRPAGAGLVAGLRRAVVPARELPARRGLDLGHLRRRRTLTRWHGPPGLGSATLGAMARSSGRGAAEQREVRRLARARDRVARRVLSRRPSGHRGHRPRSDRPAGGPRVRWATDRGRHGDRRDRHRRREPRLAGAADPRVRGVRREELRLVSCASRADRSATGTPVHRTCRRSSPTVGGGRRPGRRRPRRPQR
ncbi:MAG: S-methyl-5-thioribose-1-phosphate isomerase [Acidimicrobiia bacterium]|nr:S-methyl-5-thioribose-1-phosphate isomerase [Acidimicrobiia bacterium]